MMEAKYPQQVYRVTQLLQRATGLKQQHRRRRLFVHMAESQHNVLS